LLRDIGNNRSNRMLCCTTPSTTTPIAEHLA
ncbi:hypothetical protein V3C99_003467, partial [Haemonchus contortus]